MKKKIRYIYWFLFEFIKKNSRFIFLSFFISFIFIIGLISTAPYLETAFLAKKQKIGIVGKYELNNLPEEILEKISSGLVYINENGKAIPALASSWEIANEGKKYRVILKEDLFWSDGKKFTADDINYQFKDVKIEVVDERMIYFNLEKPLPIFLTYLKTPIIKYPLKGVAGLYRVDHLKTQYDMVKLIRLSPNKKDYSPVEYRFFDNETQLVSAYKKGEINQMTVNKKSIAQIFTLWKNTQVEKTVNYSKLLTIFFDMNNPFLKEKDVRDAIIMSLDLNILNEDGEQAIGPVPPTSIRYDSNLKAEVYNPKAAENIIKKLTEKKEPQKLNLYTYYEYLDYASLIGQNLKDIGLDININFITYQKPENFDLLIAFWKVPPDHDQYYFWHSTQTQGNVSNYKNVKVDKLLEDIREVTDSDQEKQIFSDFQKNILNDPPAAFLIYPYSYTIKRK